MKNSSTTTLVNAKALHYTYDRDSLQKYICIFILMTIHDFIYFVYIIVTCIFIIEIVCVLLDFTKKPSYRVF